jgi:hypothetical protein
MRVLVLALVLLNLNISFADALEIKPFEPKTKDPVCTVKLFEHYDNKDFFWGEVSVQLTPQPKVVRVVFQRELKEMNTQGEETVYVREGTLTVVSEYSARTWAKLKAPRLSKNGSELQLSLPYLRLENVVSRGTLSMSQFADDAKNKETLFAPAELLIKDRGVTPYVIPLQARAPKTCFLNSL